MYSKEFYSTGREYYQILNDILEQGKEVAVRDNLQTREFSPAVLTFKDPRERYINPLGRNLNLPFAIAETLDIIFKQNPGTAIFYNKNLKNWINESTGKFDGHYGDRINLANMNQLDNVYQILKKDPSSRQAVLTIHNPLLENFSGKDIACTLSLHFMIREGKLNLTTVMRSNDLFLGFCYDTFTFQFLQEMIASWLKVELGTYTHIANSLHIYERDMPKIQKIFELDPWNEPSVYLTHSPTHFALEKDEGMKQLERLNILNLAITSQNINRTFIQDYAQNYEITDPLLNNMTKVLLTEYNRRQKNVSNMKYWSDSITNEYKSYFTEKEENKHAIQ